MVTIKALWRDGKTPQAQAANVGRIDDELLLLRDGRQYRYRLADIRLEAGVADLPDTVQLPDGGTLEVADRIAIRRLIGGLSWGDRSGHWLQQSWRALAGLALLAIAALWLGYRHLLPLAAGALAPLVPVAVEQALADSTLQWLDQSGAIGPSRHGEARRARRARLQQQLQVLLPDSRYRYRLLLRDAAVIGPNAFALPGGTIVVTDQLLALIQRNDELLVLPVSLANADYSRAHEREADRFAYARLRAHGLSPCLLGYSLQRIEAATHPQTTDDENSPGSWFASHPDTSARSQPDGVRCPPLPD
ncbi:peptidase M48-like protein [Vogesella indigofera]|uniref:Peptidase M48-like protein n=1 Tax=Vogesella indigofera TaxID=45465 RepID=A0A495AY20_VOGIN|nr:M48 family metallopeptidase [Vogesella indigofera]RKQ53230.1 peptidase M48-like protein [Vogesella indigofera]